MLDWATLAAVIAILGTLLVTNHRLETRLDAKISALDAKFDRKIDDVRRDVLGVSRDMVVLSQDIRHDILMLSRDIGRAHHSYREEEISTPV